MISRMEVIDTLQASRPEVVKLFDQIVATLPEGVYLTSVKQSGQEDRIQRRRAVEHPRVRVHAQHRRLGDDCRRRSSRSSRPARTPGPAPSSRCSRDARSGRRRRRSARKETQHARFGGHANEFRRTAAASSISRDIGRWPFLFRALGVLIVFLVTIGCCLVLRRSQRQPGGPAQGPSRAGHRCGTPSTRSSARRRTSRPIASSSPRSSAPSARCCASCPARPRCPRCWWTSPRPASRPASRSTCSSPGTETRKDFYAELPIKIQLTGGYHEFGNVRQRHRGAAAHRHAARHRDHRGSGRASNSRKAARRRRPTS